MIYQAVLRRNKVVLVAQAETNAVIILIEI